MKITINTDITTTLPKSKDFLKKEIVEKLNRLTTSLNSNFFSWDGDVMKISSCANTDIHNKLVILMSLFTDSNSNVYCTYTSFGSGVSFYGYNTLESLTVLNNFVDSIPNVVKEIEIEIK